MRMLMGRTGTCACRDLGRMSGAFDTAADSADRLKRRIVFRLSSHIIAFGHPFRKRDGQKAGNLLE